MKSKPNDITWRQVPIGCIHMAQRRTSEMVSHWGRNIRSMDIETLAASIYLQGIEDAFTFYEKQNIKPVLVNQDAVPLALEAGLLGSGSI